MSFFRMEFGHSTRVPRWIAAHHPGERFAAVVVAGAADGRAGFRQGLAAIVIRTAATARTGTRDRLGAVVVGASRAARPQAGEPGAGSLG